MKSRVRPREESDEVVAQVEARAKALQPKAELVHDPVWQLVHQSKRSDVVRIDRCSFGDSECQKAIRILADYDELKDLRLQLGIGSDTMTEFLKIIRRNATTLRHIDLSRNRLGPKTALAVAQLLPELPKVVFLDMSFNPVGDEGGSALLQALATHPSLRVLRLRHCWLSDPTAVCAATVLKTTSKPLTLGLGGNCIGHLGLRQLQLPLRGDVAISASDQRPRRS
jgi:Ran GTPase-activating protein (RanGAP) involved in mRNA processing and transport